MTGKLARTASIIVDFFSESCEYHNLREEDLPGSLQALLVSLQRFVSSVITVLPDPHDLTMDQRAG